MRGTGDNILCAGQPKVHRNLILNIAQYHVHRRVGSESRIESEIKGLYWKSGRTGLESDSETGGRRKILEYRENALIRFCDLAGRGAERPQGSGEGPGYGTMWWGPPLSYGQLGP